MDDQIAFRFNSYIKAVEQAWQSEESTKTEGSLAVLIAMVDRLTGYVQSLPTRQLQFTENDVLRCLTLIDGLVNKLPKNSRIATDRMVETLTSGTGLKANGVIMRHRQILQQRKEAALAAANKQSKIAVTAADDKPQARTVLLIEDDRIMAKHVSNQLMQYGYFVSWVEDFDSVENLLETGTPDCIISDIRIGDDDTKGTRFFMEMRERNLALPPLIFLSSMTEFSIRLEALRAGGHGFVTKPYSTGELVEVVDSIFEIREKEAMRFVIVDDNERDLVNLSGALTDISAQVRTCRTPDRILDDLAEFRPDVLVLSANMLSVGGIEIAKVVRQDNRYVSLSIVVLTNEGDNQSQAESLIQGSDTFLVKSISPKILAAVLMGQAQRARDIAG